MREIPWENLQPRRVYVYDGAKVVFGSFQVEGAYCYLQKIERWPPVRCFVSRDHGVFYKKVSGWLILKCLVRFLRLHQRAAVTANHPLRKQARGEFKSNE